MRVSLPTARERRFVDRSLVAFFREYRMADFNRALTTLARFYNLARPKVDWYEYLDWGKTGGRTYENGKVHLVHPENWKNGRRYNSERRWIHTVYHEMAHYLFWADAERKADTFARRMVRGIQSTSRNGRARSASRNGHARATRPRGRASR